jgi:hypothetical protein
VQHWIKTQSDDVARWRGIHVINTGPPFADVENALVIVAGVAYIDVSTDWSDDVSNDFA